MIPANELAPADGKLVGVTQLQDLRNVEGRKTPFTARIVRILQAGETSQIDVVGAGQRGIVDRLGKSIGREEFQTRREAFLRPDLQCVINRVGDRRLVAGESTKELRIGHLQLQFLDLRIGQQWVVGIGDELRRVGLGGIEEGVVHVRSQVRNLGIGVVLDLRSQVIDAARIGEVEVGSFLADVRSIENQIPFHFVLNAKTPALLVRHGVADATNGPVGTVTHVVQQAQAAARRFDRTVGIGIAHPRGGRGSVPLERGYQVGYLVESLLPNTGSAGNRSSPCRKVNAVAAANHGVVERPVGEAKARLNILVVGRIGMPVVELAKTSPPVRFLPSNVIGDCTLGSSQFSSLFRSVRGSTTS